MKLKMPCTLIVDGAHRQHTLTSVGRSALNVVRGDVTARVERACFRDAMTCTGKYPSGRVHGAGVGHEGIGTRGDFCWQPAAKKLGDSDGVQLRANGRPTPLLPQGPARHVTTSATA